MHLFLFLYISRWSQQYVVMQGYYIVIDYILCIVYFITVTHLFCNWKFGLLYFPLLFLSSPTTLLPSGNHLFVLYIYNSVPILLYLFTCYCFFFLPSIYNLNHTVFTFLCLTYFTKSNALQVHLCYHKWQDSYSVGYMHYIFIHSSIDGHVGFLLILAIVNNASGSIGVCISFQINVFIESHEIKHFCHWAIGD